METQIEKREVDKMKGWPECVPDFSSKKLHSLQTAMAKTCRVYITGCGILTFDATMPKYQGNVNKTWEAAKWHSIRQPVLLHTKPVHHVVIFNRNIVGRIK